MVVGQKGDKEKVKAARLGIWEDGRATNRNANLLRSVGLGRWIAWCIFNTMILGCYKI